ncbi:SpoIIE family protein phosphatase [Nocardioides lianchengensis]|uniref:histidine kinase n=1 Tax=Nocardioides lianchengensis TaxID=1045774 RepID=A0A1G6Q5A7_9ACTN|nr:SpoIIE family protein phosphatase [Nocardioides lianchengensis]NYG12087.1 signal transduction histidine kinase/DNA-binding response OmpR family regulator [Nocardioides lianchengensis]SDC87124.1 Signal transduction histidine kinase [Nocardioides lianchengensis]
MSAARSMEDVLAASGEVGADLLRVDWSGTPLGRPDGWPLSLRNAVRILLTSKFSMWMAWGPELTFFCNDAYRRDTLGGKYPWALGRSAAEVWSEIWTDIAPRIETVMSTGEATWDEALLLFLERSGYAEETYHTFSYSPLADDDGQIAGMLCVVTEDTEQVVATGRMATLRDLGIRVAGARDERHAVRTACAQLAQDPRSLPFAAVYLFEDDGRTARLAGAAGVEGEHAAFPPLVVADDPAATWPAPRLWEGEALVHDLDRFADLPRGAWPEPPLQAYLTPLLQPAQAHPYGFLVAGLNRYRPFDDAYRGFVDLVAGHLAAAVSDARAIEAETQRAETLARLDQAKTDFFANVSHELRTPLTLLLGPTEDALADEAEPLAPVHRDRLATVLRNGQRMLQLVNTLLDFSRLEAGRAAPELRLTDLGQATGELAAMFQSAAERAGLRLEIDVRPGTEAYVDRDHWAKIVLNLLSNALKFTFEGEVSVRLGVDGDCAVLSVRDTGSGIPESEVPHLFERFHRVAGARSRTHEGSGIGLALVAELVALHGGTVGVASRLGEGTTLTVAVPLGRDHLDPAYLVDDTSAGAIVDGRTGQMVAQALSWLPEEDEATDAVAPDPDRADQPRVLVVDDNADMRTYVAGILREEYDVSVASDGVEALALMAEQRPHLVVTDVMMPRLDGFGLLQRMQADPVLTVVPVVMLSARAGEEGTLEGLAAGAVDYLVKPFSARELLARVRVNLELDREQRVRHALELNEELLDQAQRLARIGSWEIDLDTDTIVASRTFHELMQMDRETMDRLGTTAVIESLVHPDDLPMVRERLGEAIDGEVIEYETRIVLPTGEQRLFHARGEVVPRADGARILRGSFQDVTEQDATRRRLVAAEAEREAAVRERRVAEQLQASLLPASDFEVDSLEVATFYRAGVEGTYVGGDWYDVIDLGAGRTAFVIGDVMGRGVPAAAVMGQLRAAVRAFATLDLGPAEVLEHLDNLVQELAADQIVTCVYAVHDAAEQTFTYANAGHLPPLLARHDLVETMARIEATGPPLGAGYFGMTAEVYDVRADDVVVLYTDGLVERRGEDLFAGISQLADLVRAHGDQPLRRLPETLVRSLVGDDGGDDDVALVLVKVEEPQELTFTARLAEVGTAPRDARRAVADQLGRWGVRAEAVDDLVLITSELVTNALVHARPPIDLRLRRTGHQVVLEVRDRAQLRPRRRRPEESDENGRGLNIVEVLSESWGTRTNESGKTVWCSVRVDD